MKLDDVASPGIWIPAAGLVALLLLLKVRNIGHRLRASEGAARSQGAYADAQRVRAEKAETRADHAEARADDAEARLRSLGDLEARKTSLAGELAEAEQLIQTLREANAREIAQLQASHRTAVETATAELDALRAAITSADTSLDEREASLYPRMYADENSAQLKSRMDAIDAQQSEIRRKGQVVINFGASVQAHLSPEERAQTKSLVRLARLALEGACDVLLAKTRATNVGRLDERFKAIVIDLDRALKPWGFQIGKNYQATVHAAIALQAEYLQQLDRERDEQRALREQMREEAAAQHEAERAQKAAEVEEARAKRDLESARRAAAEATESERAKWTAHVAELESALAAAKTQKERATALAQLTKRGHVYVISNIGSFGEDVYKVGMTRRLDPLDRVHELSDASVPFPFDVHGMIASDDCPTLEGRLHIALDNHRMNLVNERKEFFRISFADLRSALATAGCDVAYTELAEAMQFRQSKLLRAGARPPALALEQAMVEVAAEDMADEDAPTALGERGSRPPT